MVLMAQPFSFRYPLVDGQATGARQTTLNLLLPCAIPKRDCRATPTCCWQNLVKALSTMWRILTAPLTSLPLPAQVPYLLLNGSTGIAVGMATDIPPHNFNEVLSACIHMLDNPKASVADLLTHIKARLSDRGTNHYAGIRNSRNL